MKRLNILYCYLLHGLDRSKDDYEFIKQKTEEVFNKVFINKEDSEIHNLIYSHCSTSHTGTKSRQHLCVTSKNDLIEFGEFFENTIMKELKENEEKYNKFENVECNIYISISGHSLGGLISRGLIKNIFSPYTHEDTQYDNYLDYLKKKYPFITDFKPCSFLTLSSPHLGSRVSEPAKANNVQKKLEKIATRVFTDHLISNIGKELAVRDELIKNNEYYKDKRPILCQFCDKEYMDALAKFPNRTLTGFLRYDLQVKYCTAFACLESPLNDLLKEKDSNVFDERTVVDTKIVAISGYQEGSEMEYYKKELFNERVLENFYYNDTRYLEPPNIDEQIKQNLIRNGEDPNMSEDELKDKFLIDNENQSEVPVYALKNFNSIPWRRVSIDLLLPRGLDRLGTHGACLGTKWTLIDKQCIKDIAAKTINFYGNLLIADYILTSEQQDSYSL